MKSTTTESAKIRKQFRQYLDAHWQDNYPIFRTSQFYEPFYKDSGIYPSAELKHKLLMGKRHLIVGMKFPLMIRRAMKICRYTVKEI